MSSFYGNGGYSSGGGGGSGEVTSVNGKKGQVTLDAADVHALPEDTLIPSLEGLATEEWVQEQGYATEGEIPTHMVNGSAAGSVRGINTASEDSSYTMGTYAFAEGYTTKASGLRSHAEGFETTASGQDSHAEGSSTTASGSSSHAEGSGNQATNYSSHAEGGWTTASGTGSHAEGMSTTASGIASHAENMSTTAVGDYSHAEGNSTTASGPQAHAEGISTTASGMASHAEGGGTTAQGYMQHVMGEYNVPQGTQDSHTSSDYIFIVGNGTAQNPSNAFAMKWDGTFVFANSTEITPAQFASLYNINNKIPLTGNETEGQVLTIDENGQPKWDNTSFVKVTDDGQGNVSMETLYGVLIDAVPTQNSNNLVTSGGVYAMQSPTIDFRVSSFTNNTPVTCNMTWEQIYNTTGSQKEKNIILHDTYASQSFYCYKAVKTSGLGGVTISFYFLNEDLNTQYVVKTHSSGSMTLLVNNLLSNYALKSEIPTVTNDFTNDYKNKVDSLWEDYQDAITALG